MITITNKTDCCGCGACASRCVTSCITMAPDEEGFNYPLVDTDKCIHCGLCERVCPLLHKPQPHEILAVIGCKNKTKPFALSAPAAVFSPWLPKKSWDVRGQSSGRPLTTTGTLDISLSQAAMQ